MLQAKMRRISRAQCRTAFFLSPTPWTSPGAALHARWDLLRKITSGMCQTKDANAGLAPDDQGARKLDGSQVAHLYAC